MTKPAVLRNALLVALMMVFGATGSVSAQNAPEKNYCGYTGMSSWLDWYHDNKDQFALDRGSDTSWLYVPITIHIVGDDNGNGYFQLDQAFKAACSMNRMFEQARIRFYLYEGDEFRYHNNSDWHEHSWGAGGQMIESERIPGRMNCFVVADPAGNCGYSWRDAIVMSISCSGPSNSTWAHEAGHHLSLPHPFVGWEGENGPFNQPAPAFVGGREVEKVDGSNCSTASDRFCDTRPDYLSNRWPCNSDFESNTVQRDPNGEEFRSDATLIMGYASDRCQSVFTPEQIAAMRANLNDEHIEYLQVTEPGLSIPDGTTISLVGPIDSAEVQFNDIRLTWEPVPNARYYTVELSPFENFSLIIFKETTTGNSANVDVLVPNNRLVYWRVRAFGNWNLCPDDTESELGVFQTKNLSATNDLERHATTFLMPNPATAGMPARLMIDSDEPMEALLSLHDAAGRLCYQQDIRLFSGENNIEILTDRLESGLYTVTLQNEMGSIVHRLAIVN